jgi:large subunit ribosomal protein L31
MMKAKIHPRYGPATVTCACGSTFMTRATKPDIRIEICSQCHPFFTGRQKLLDTEGRVERFKAKYAGIERKSALRRRRAPGGR